jgi:hypothetical protein
MKKSTKIILFVLFLVSLISFSIFVSAQQQNPIKKFHPATYEADSVIYVRDDQTITITDSINVVFTDTANLVRFVNITKKQTLSIEVIQQAGSKTLEQYNEKGEKENLTVVWFYCLVNGEHQEVFTMLSLPDGEVAAVGIGTQSYFTVISLKRKKQYDKKLK